MTCGPRQLCRTTISELKDIFDTHFSLNIIAPRCDSKIAVIHIVILIKFPLIVLPYSMRYCLCSNQSCLLSYVKFQIPKVRLKQSNQNQSIKKIKLLTEEYENRNKVGFKATLWNFHCDLWL